MKFEVVVDGTQYMDLVIQEISPAVIVVPPTNNFITPINHPNIDILFSSVKSSVYLGYYEFTNATPGGRSRKKR